MWQRPLFPISKTVRICYNKIDYDQWEVTGMEKVKLTKFIEKMKLVNEVVSIIDLVSFVDA